MSVDLAFDTHSDPEAVIATADCRGGDLIGREAAFTIAAQSKVHDSRAVNASNEVFSYRFTIGAQREQIRIRRHSLPNYTYRGKHVDVELHAQLCVDGSFFFDTKVKEEVNLELARRPNVNVDSKALIEPQDAFNLLANWMAIPAYNKLFTLALLATLGVVAAVNSIIGVHDQLSPESRTYLYSHRDSDGDGQSPLVNSTIVSGGIAAALWYAIRRQLRKYMTFEAGDSLPRIDRDTTACVRDLFRGRSRVPLDKAVIRIVACNMEKGQYKRGSGSSERTVSFTEPVRALVLYEKRLAQIPRSAPVEELCPEQVAFAPIFDVLYPPNPVSTSHGIEVYWEIQLLHDRYVDQEIVGCCSGLVRQDFYAPRTAKIASDAIPANF